MNWPDRIDNYRREIGTPYLAYENDWCFGAWFIGNFYKKKTDYYGAYQGNYLKRVAALFPDRRKVLHLFSGEVDVDTFPGDTLDSRTDLKVNPTYCVNAETCEGVPLHYYDFVLATIPAVDRLRINGASRSDGTAKRRTPDLFSLALRSVR
jgi:hypothetical protein